MPNGYFYQGSNDALKVKELGNTIFNVDVNSTPISRLLKRGKAPRDMLSTHPVKSYPDDGFGGTMDGHDKSSFDRTAREPVQETATWLMSPGFMVSKIKQLTAEAGVDVGQELGVQRADDGVRLARMIERQLLSAVDCQVESGADKPWLSRGLFSWLSAVAQGTYPVPASARPGTDQVHTGTLAAFTPDVFEAMLAAASERSNAPVNLTGVVGIKLKRQMSLWAQRDTSADATNKALQQFTQNAADKSLTQIVDLFDFDAGSVRTMLSYFLRCDPETGAKTAYSPRSGLFLDMSMLSLDFMQAPTSWDCPPQSGGPRGYTDAVYKLGCGNAAAMCMAEINTDA